MAERTARTWDVLLVCGASGVGKSSLSYPLAARHGVTVLEVDDLVCAVQAVTTSETMPAVHFWDTHPDPTSLSAAQVFEQGLALLGEIGPAVEAVIGNHLETGVPVVVDGDFIAPSLATAGTFAGHQNDGRVKAVLLTEDEEQVVANYLGPGAGTGRTDAAGGGELPVVGVAGRRSKPASSRWSRLDRGRPCWTAIERSLAN